jgi:hypothetical protein
LGNQLGNARRITREPRLGQPEHHRQGDQALLRAVVQIALDAWALGVGGGDDALPGVVQVVDALAQGARAPRFSGLAWETDWLHLTFSLAPGSTRRLLARVLTQLSSSSYRDLTGGVLNTVHKVVRDLADDGRAP